MRDDGEAERARISQHAAHDAGIGYAPATGGDGARAGLFHQADFGKFLAFEAFRGRGDRMDPQVGLATLRGALDQPGAVERVGWSAMLLSISTPRFIGPGCLTIASIFAFSSRFGVRP
jgi:hypothetical protein